MKKLLEFVGGVLILQGCGALLHEMFGWFDRWTIVQHLGPLDGYEVYAGISLVVLGLGLCAAAEHVPS